MSPFTHLFLSWLVAETAPSLSPRERALVTLSGVIPDIDGAGVFVEMATRDSENPLLWFSQYHHLLHNALFGATVVAVAMLLSKKRALVGALSVVAFHLHLLCDIIGARGPDGAQWPIPYLLPFDSRIALAWEHQWSLNAWPNFLITGAAMIAIVCLARNRGYSIVSLVSKRADREFVEAIRRRFPVAPQSPG
jgi:hypothetical protein